MAAGHDCDCRVLDARDVPRALANCDTRGAVKLVIDADTRKVLGVHAALDGAGDVMLAATYAITFGLTIDDLADTWAPYDDGRGAAHGRRSVPLRHANQLLRVVERSSCFDSPIIRPAVPTPDGVFRASTAGSAHPG